MWLISLFMLSLSFSSNTSNPTYCIPLDKFDLNPYREIEDGKELAYLPTLFLSFISKSSADKGILSNYEFSPDGKLFKGRINREILWSDGSQVTAQEFVLSFLRTLSYRALGKRVVVEGIRDDNINFKAINSTSSIKFNGDNGFEIIFKTDIKNLTGVLRDAISTGSRHNRFWLHKKNSSGKDLYVTRYKIINSSPEKILIEVDGMKLELVTKSLCENADMGIYPESFTKSVDQYSYVESPIKQAVTVVFNTKRHNLNSRLEIASFVKKSFETQSISREVRPVNSFFLKGEPGYYEHPKWSNIKSEVKGNSSYAILYEIPVLKMILGENCKLCKFGTASDSMTGVDFQILSSAIFEGRHIILQDMLQWNDVTEFLELAPKTTALLKKIAIQSAATVPPNNQLLIDFEKASRDELSVMPVARRAVNAYTKKGIGISLDWNEGGELIFKKQKPSRSEGN